MHLSALGFVWVFNRIAGHGSNRLIAGFRWWIWLFAEFGQAPGLTAERMQELTILAGGIGHGVIGDRFNRTNNGHDTRPAESQRGRVRAGRHRERHKHQG
jgi:hypothetical protein